MLDSESLNCDRKPFASREREDEVGGGTLSQEICDATVLHIICRLRSTFSLPCCMDLEWVRFVGRGCVGLRRLTGRSFRVSRAALCQAGCRRC